MTDTPPPDQPLEIRGRPRPVKRFSKRALILLLGTGSAIVLGALCFALRGNGQDSAGPVRELYRTGHNPTADALAALPASYEELRPEPDMLGPPLPGDLGAPILRAQREGRLGGLEDSPQSDALQEDAAGMQTELRARQAALAESARTSDIFFKRGSDIGRSHIQEDPLGTL